jgi:hypothetical protein
MKRLFPLLLLFLIIVFIYSGCNKKDRGGPALQSGCLTEVFSVPSWYVDSIYYSDNKISQINKTYRNDNTKNTQARLEYSANEVKIFVRDFFEGSWRDVITPRTQRYRRSKPTAAE